jgi:hypothetical protein
LPFFTDATTMSPAAAAGRRLRRAPTPCTAMTKRFLAPELSAQFITAPTGSASVRRNLLPAWGFDIVDTGRWKSVRNG